MDRRIKSSRYVGVSTAEALAREGGVRPLCKCHGEPMGWRKTPVMTAGGRWFCRVKHREHMREKRRRSGVTPFGSSEHRAKLSAALTGRKPTPESNAARAAKLRTPGGKRLHHGYVLLYCPRHPDADPQGYVREHRFRAECALRRFLRREEAVHHLDFQRHNNRLNNLTVLPEPAHGKLHALLQQHRITPSESVQLARLWMLEEALTRDDERPRVTS